VISQVVIGLKTVKGTKQLKLDPTIYEAMQKEKISVGDVIYIEANSGAVKRVGRCDAYATEYDLEAEEYVPMPKVSPKLAPPLSLLLDWPPRGWIMCGLSVLQGGADGHGGVAVGLVST
jgi:hypothetical protein